MAFKFKILNLKEVLNAFGKIFEEDLSNKNLLDEMGESVKTRIQQQTRRGKDLSRDGDNQPRLSEKYIQYRKRLAKGNTRDGKKPDPEFFKPSKSNLTLTGQLLKSLDVTVNQNTKEISVKPKGIRDDGLTNEEVTRDLAQSGRTFLGLDKTGIKVLKKRILDEIRREIIKKRFSKR